MGFIICCEKFAWTQPFKKGHFGILWGRKYGHDVEEQIIRKDILCLMLFTAAITFHLTSARSYFSNHVGEVQGHEADRTPWYVNPFEDFRRIWWIVQAASITINFTYNNLFEVMSPDVKYKRILLLRVYIYIVILGDSVAGFKSKFTEIYIILSSIKSASMKLHGWFKVKINPIESMALVYLPTWMV